MGLKKSLAWSFVVVFLIAINLIAFVGAQSQNSDKTEESINADLGNTQEQNFKEWPAMSAEIISPVEVVENDVYKAEFFDVVLEIEKPRLEELVENSKEYFSFLEENLGDAGKGIVRDTIDDWRKGLESVEVQTMEIAGSAVKLSKKNEAANTISFYKNLYKYQSGWKVSDPVNLVFYNKGNYGNVDYRMKNNLTNKWRGAWGGDLYTGIDRDHADGANWVWKKQDTQLEKGNFFTTRYHIRVYDGGNDWDSFKQWSDAGVHYEYFNGIGHTVMSWENAEKFVRDDFTGKWFTGAVWQANIGNAGYYQNVYNDGKATVIELRN